MGLMENFCVHMQCHKNEKATEFCVYKFREIYPNIPFRLVSDNGSDYSNLSEKYNLNYEFDPKSSFNKSGHFNEFEGMSLYLKRIKDTCLKFSDKEWVIIFEEDVLTKRKINKFPDTAAAGLCVNKLRDPLENYIKKINKKTKTIGYGMCGGSIFKRKEFLNCMDKAESFFDPDSGWSGPALLFLETLDKRIVHWGDIALTTFFLINGYDYSVWEELEQSNSRNGNAAFEHNFKKYY